MPVAGSPERPTARPPGRLGKALLRLFMKPATVAAIERPADRFHLVTLEGAALLGVAWTPGQKIQIAMGSAFATRTYTPIDWDVATGRTRILGYAHGDGPGSAWLNALAPGVECDIFGPRGSLDVGRVTGPLAIYGDETAIGLAYALTRHDPARPCACHFEVSDVESAQTAMAHLRLDGAALFEKAGGDAHLDRMEATLPERAATGTAFVLTGKAATIQRLRHALKRQGVAAADILTKAYWAPGKTGLD